jgi:hypothetical protein
LKKSKIVSITFIILLVATVFYIFGCTSSDKDEEPGCGSMLLAAIARRINPEGCDRAEKDLFGDYISSMEKELAKALKDGPL